MNQLPATCRLFVDEVGNSDLRGSSTDENVRYLSLTGIVTKIAAHDRLFQPKLDELKSQHFGLTAGSQVILHRREILRGENAFSCLQDEHRRSKFDRDIQKLLEDLPYIVITVVIDKKEHLERYSLWHFDPYHYCLCCIVERYVLWLRRHGLRGDVAIEPRFKKADKRIKASFNLIYESGTDHIPGDVVRAHLTSHEIKFMPKSQNVAGMQICDLLAHPSFRSMKFERLGRSDPNDFGTSIANMLIKSKYSRNPKDHSKIAGWGRKWLP